MVINANDPSHGPFARRSRTVRLTTAAFALALALAPAATQAASDDASVASSRHADHFALFDAEARCALPRLALAPEGLAILERAEAGLTRPHGAIPVLHTEGTLPGRGIREFSARAREDFPVVQALALAYRMTGETRFRDAAERYLLAWAGTYRWSFNPIDETGFDALLIASDLIEDDLSPDSRARLMDFWHRLSTGYLDAMDGAPINAHTNWQSHRIKQATLAAYAVGDVALIDRARAAYRRHVSGNIQADGSVHDFHERDAIHYVTYNLDPLMTAALAAGEHGEDWFGWRNENGAGARDTILWLLPYAEGRRTHQEFVRSTIKFDADRAAVGQPGYTGQWNPGGAVNTLRLAALLDDRFSAEASALSERVDKPAAPWMTLMSQARATGRNCSR